MVQTVADGRVWVFAALDHFKSEVVGHYVSTDGSCFAAAVAGRHLACGRHSIVGLVCRPPFQYWRPTQFGSN
jgi:putative transposase